MAFKWGKLWQVLKFLAEHSDTIVTVVEAAKKGESKK